MQRKKSFCGNFFSRSVKKALPRPEVENASFLSNPDTGVTTSSQLQRIPPSSYRVPTASDHMNKAGTEENAKLDLDGLIMHIYKLFEFREGKISSYNLKTAQQYWPTSQSFINLRKLLYEGTNYANNISSVSAKSSSLSAKIIVSSLLQSMGSANNIIAAGFLVVANILERIEEVRTNRMECLSLLREMTKLAKVVKDFKERAHLKEKMHDEIKDATSLILEGSLMCCAQIDSSKFSKFFNTTVNREELVKIRKDLDSMYRDLQNKMGIYILENTEKISEKITILSNQNEVPDQRRAYPKHPADAQPPPIIIYAQTVNLQTGPLPPSTGYPEYPSRLPCISENQGRARSDVEKRWQQEQAQCALQSNKKSSAQRNDLGKIDQGGQPTRAQTLGGVETKEQHKPSAEKGAIEKREEQPLKKAEEDKRKEQEKKTKEADQKTVRQAEDKKTMAKNEEDVKRARDAETRKPPTGIQPQKGPTSEESWRKKDKPEEHTKQGEIRASKGNHSLIGQ